MRSNLSSKAYRRYRITPSTTANELAARVGELYQDSDTIAVWVDKESHTLVHEVAVEGSVDTQYELTVQEMVGRLEIEELLDDSSSILSLLLHSSNVLEGRGLFMSTIVCGSISALSARLGTKLSTSILGVPIVEIDDYPRGCVLVLGSESRFATVLTLSYGVRLSI